MSLWVRPAIVAKGESATLSSSAHTLACDLLRGVLPLFALAAKYPLLSAAVLQRPRITVVPAGKEIVLVEKSVLPSAGMSVNVGTVDISMLYCDDRWASDMLRTLQLTVRFYPFCFGRLSCDSPLNIYC